MASIDKLIERLGRGKTVPAIVLQGSDAYLLDLCRKKIIEAYVPEGARDWAVARIAVRESGWDEVVQRAQTMPMLASRQVIFVEGVEAIEKLGDKARDGIVDALESYFASPAPFTVLVLEAEHLDGRQKFTKLLQEKAIVAEMDIGGESAASLASQMAKDLGVAIDPDAAGLLAEILNNEPARIRVEIEKLSAFVLGSGRVTAADVEKLVVAARKNTVWQFADMIASRKRDVALAFLDNLLREGEQPIGLVGVMSRMYRQLIEARELPPTMNMYQAAGILHVPPQAADAILRTARRIPKRELLAGLVALAEADSQLKSSNPNPRAFIEFLIARLTSPMVATAP
jgi:DNA polymerase-3 subunit delta